MDAVVQGGGDRGFLWQNSLDDFDALREPSPYEVHPPPPVWSSLDLGGPNGLADQKPWGMEPNACAVEPVTYNHLKSQATPSVIPAASPATTTCSSYYFLTSQVCDDRLDPLALQIYSDVASPEVCFHSISHSSSGLAQPTPHPSHPSHAEHDRSSQPPARLSISTEPAYEQYQIAHVHMYPTSSSPSVATQIVGSPLETIDGQVQPASLNTPIQPSASTILSSSQFEFSLEIPTTTYQSFPPRKPSNSQSAYENTILSTEAIINTPAEVREFSFSATTPSTITLRNTKAPSRSKRKRDDYNLDNTCSEVAFKDKSGAVAAYTQVFGTARNLRQAYSEGQRKEIARTRRLGACERCKRFKMKCHRPDSPYQLCLRCVMSSPQVLSMPCFLAKPVDAELFRDKPSIMHPLQTPRSEVYRLLDIEAPQYPCIELQLTQDLGETLLVRVTQYEPRPNEKTSHPWKDRSGNSRALNMPPYCIANMSAVRESMLEYINAFRGAFLSKLRMSCNEITGKIIDEARRYAAFKPTSTVRKAIDLFAATRIIENDWRICGKDTLGVSVVEDEENPWFGKIPVTPIMDTQLDQIVIQGFLKPLRDQLLEELQKKIYENRRENWFEIFLTTSILLTNAELLLSHSRQNAKRYGANRRYNSLERALKYFHTCNLLIAHFHFVCIGFAPLKLDWASSSASSMAVLDRDQMRFMTQLQDMIRRKEEYVLSLRAKREYESELYWCHQLFFEKWEWEKPRIEEGVEEN